MKRWQIIVSTGGILIALGFFLFPQAIEWWFFRNSNQKFHRLFVVYPTNRVSAFAPVILWDENVPKDEAPWQEKGKVILSVRNEDVFIEEQKISREVLRSLIDEKVVHEKVEYLIVVPSKKTSWNELWNVLDDLRQSKADVIIVKHE